MRQVPENQELDKVKEDIKDNLKDFRKRAENRIMDNSTWNTSHRLKLRSLIDKMLDIQIELNEL